MQEGVAWGQSGYHDQGMFEQRPMTRGSDGGSQVRARRSVWLEQSEGETRWGDS